MVDLTPVAKPTGQESMITRKILVTGATGKQGGAVVQALLSHPPPFAHQILAVTRNTSSAAAKALAQNAKVELLQGDLDDCPSLFEKAGGKGAVWGVFSMQLPEMAKKAPLENKETIQGCALVDAAIQYGVSHFVYSSVERGGDVRSETNATEIGHFVTKYHVEEHLRSKAKDYEMTWTILRPVAFMENCGPNMFGRVFATMWADMGDKKLQLVSVKDIGIFAALVFASPEKEEFRNKSIGLAGDDLSQEEAEEVFWKALHRPMPRSWWILGWLLQTFVPEVGTMFKWFKDEGYGADIQLNRRINPEMMDFERYLKEKSGFTAW